MDLNHRPPVYIGLFWAELPLHELVERDGLEPPTSGMNPRSFAELPLHVNRYRAPRVPQPHGRNESGRTAGFCPRDLSHIRRVLY